MRAANREGMLYAQIETVAGVENCDAIAAVDGIDCLWVGHFDLTQSMGIPAPPDNPHSSTTSHASPRPCEAHGKAAGRHGQRRNRPVWKDLGYRAFAYNGDLWIYGAALKAGIDGVRAL